MPPRRTPWYAAVDATRWARYMRGAWRRFAVRLMARTNWRRLSLRLVVAWRAAIRCILARARGLRR